MGVGGEAGQEPWEDGGAALHCNLWVLLTKSRECVKVRASSFCCGEAEDIYCSIMTLHLSA